LVTAINKENMFKTMNDTIAAISTPIGQGGIGIIRLSGQDVLPIADKIFVSKDGGKPSGYKTYTVHYGWIVKSHQSIPDVSVGAGMSPRHQKKPSAIDHRLSTNVIDEVLLTVMRAPRSYTKEDIVEISCHNGIVVLREILDVVLSAGARLALPGEFTKRAFLNGRIDLSKAEAVLDVINAKTTRGLESGIRQLKGALSQEINKLKAKLLEVLALLEANIDFSEEEITPVQREKIAQSIDVVSGLIQALLHSASHGKILREGIRVVIVGKANVGKSSLLNALLREERAIVSPVAGTTRDAIEEILDLQGIPLKIADTAGIIEPRDFIEKEALKRTQSYFEKANLVLLVFDASRRLTQEDRALIKKASHKSVIAVLNKCDLKIRIEEGQIQRSFSRSVKISTRKQKGLMALEESIFQTVWQGNLEASEEIIITNARHIQALKEARKALQQAKDSLAREASIEFIAEDLKICSNHLAHITGEIIEEDILDKIFGEFCVGK